MIYAIRFRAEHVLNLGHHEGTQFWLSYLTPEMIKKLESYPHSYTIMNDGIVIGCAGVVPFWENRGEAWAMLDSEKSIKNMVGVHRLVKTFLNEIDMDRVEASVDQSFEQGHRWAKMLGFRLEGIRNKYRPDGAASALYARVK